MVGPFHIALSTTKGDAVTRGEPNSLACQRASKPSAVTADDDGKVLPVKLGLGQVDLNAAISSLPPCRKQSEPVPRRFTADLNAMRAPVAVGVSGAFASTVTLPLQVCSLRITSRHGCHCVSTPSIVMLSEARIPVRPPSVPNTIEASFHTKRPSLSLTKSRRRASGGTTN